MKKKNKYWQLTARIFANPYNPASVRLKSFKECFIVSCLICVVVCLPASLFLGLVAFFFPNEVPFYQFMLIPWMFFIPIIPIGVYWCYCRQPKKNDQFINRIFKSVTSSLTLTQDDSGYTFVKNGFLFELYFETLYEDSNSTKNNLKRIEVVKMIMCFDFSTSNISEYDAILAEMDVYRQGKSVGDSVFLNYHSMGIVMARKSMSEPSVVHVVDEFLYMANRFGLKPITLEGYVQSLIALDDFFYITEDDDSLYESE